MVRRPFIVAAVLVLVLAVVALAPFARAGGAAQTQFRGDHCRSYQAATLAPVRDQGAEVDARVAKTVAFLTHVFKLRVTEVSNEGRTVTLVPDASRGGSAESIEKLLAMETPYAATSATAVGATVAFRHGDDWVDAAFCS